MNWFYIFGILRHAQCPTWMKCSGETNILYYYMNYLMILRENTKIMIKSIRVVSWTNSCSIMNKFVKYLSVPATLHFIFDSASELTISEKNFKHFKTSTVHILHETPLGLRPFFSLLNIHVWTKNIGSGVYFLAPEYCTYPIHPVLPEYRK